MGACSTTPPTPSTCCVGPIDTFGDDLVVTASFGDATLVHLVSQAIPDADVVLLDTGYLFAETEWFAEQLRDRFGLRPAHRAPPPRRRARSVADRSRRVLPDAQGRAARARARRQGGVGHRRAAHRHRFAADDADRPRGPAAWSDQDQPDRQLDERRHRLAPRAVRPPRASARRPRLLVDRLLAVHPPGNGDDARSGRWAGQAKTECGLHLPIPDVQLEISR